MGRRTVCLLATLFLLILCASCGGGSADTAAGGEIRSTSAEAPMPEAPGGISAPEAGTAAGDYGGVGAQVYSRTDAKLIRRAQLTMESTDFDQAAAALDRLTESCGGYYESAETQLGGYYAYRGGRWASYTVRVPKERYADFMGKLGDVGHVVNRSESSEDVGAKYRDVELHLRTQQTKQERLLALLEKADRMEDIIALENALTEVEYQIEQYTSTLKGYDALVDFATIQISLEEVEKLTETQEEPDALGARVGAAFFQGMDHLGSSLGNMAVWVAYHFAGVLVFAAVAAAAVVVLRRKLGRPRQKTMTPSDDQKP